LGGDGGGGYTSCEPREHFQMPAFAHKKKKDANVSPQTSSFTHHMRLLNRSRSCTLSQTASLSSGKPARKVGTRAIARREHWAKAMEHLKRYPAHNGNACRELDARGLPVLYKLYVTARASTGGKAPRKEIVETAGGGGSGSGPPSG
jgi:hypothetical protein